jgi:cysteine desulfurase
VSARIYMDHNATTPVHPEVLDAMWPFYKEEWGNASSIHWAGRKPRGAVDDAREKVAALIGAPPRDLFFTSGGTESDNTALLGLLWARQDRGRHVVTSAIEHKAILDTCKAMEKLHGCEVTRLPVDRDGRIDPEQFRAALRDDTVVASVMLANNEIGNINPIKQLAAIAHERDVIFHCDAVNGFGKVPVDVEGLGVDLMSISGHKIHAPKGVGALYVRKKTPFEPLIRGGGQEKGRRCGTYNSAGIVGFGKAAEIALEAVQPQAVQRMAALRDRLEERIRGRLDRVELNGDREQRLPNTLNLSFDGVDGEGLVLALDLRGIAISTGSACTSGSLDPSHVLVALNKGERWLEAAIRFSLGRMNDAAQVDEVADAVAAEVTRLRAVQARPEPAQATA